MEPIKYDRYLSPLDVFAIAFGCTVGWGAFAMPGSTFLPLAGPFGTLIAMALGTIAMLIIGRNFSFLMQHKPGTGGIYAYTKAAYGRDHAFLSAWFLGLSYLTIVFLNATSLFIVIRTVFGSRLQIGYMSYNIGGNVIFMGEVGASIIVLSIVGLLFVNAKPFLQRLQTVLVAVMLVGVLAVAAACLPHIQLDQLQPAFGAQSSPFHGAFSIFMLAPWAFVGFEVISLETAHYKFQMSKSRWIILASVLLSGLSYIALSFVSVSAAPDGYASWQAYIADLGNLDGLAAVPSFFAAQSVLGTAGLLIIAVTAIAAILTSMIAAYRAAARLLATMAEDHILSEKFNNTTYSILFIMIISIVISLFGRNMLDRFIELTAFGAVITFGYASASAWKMAKEAGKRSVAVTGAVGTVLSVVFAIVQMIPKISMLETMGTDSFLALAVWCLLGFLFYARIVSRSSDGTHSGVSVSSVVMFALLVYSLLMWLGRRMAASPDTLILDGAITGAAVFIGLGIMIHIHRKTRRQH